MQRAADKFERKDPFPNIPFAFEADSLPAMPEVIGWIVLVAFFLMLCVGFLGIE